MTVSQAEQRQRLAETTVHATAEHLADKPEVQLQTEVASWSQEAHESVQGLSQQHLREGIEFQSQETATTASATLAPEVPNVFQTRIQPLSEDVSVDLTDRRAESAKAAVSSTELTQHLTRVRPVAESTLDRVDDDVTERGRASLTKESTDKVQTMTVQTGEALKKRPRDVTPKQKATLTREAGDVEMISTSQTLAENLLSRKPEAAVGKTKAAVIREVKSKTSLTSFQPVAEAAKDYDKDLDISERATVAHEEPDKAASTKIQPVSETVKTGIDKAKRKTSRASISQTPQDMRPTQTIQITAEAVSEQQQHKPEQVRAKVTQDNLEASQMQTAQALTAQVSFDGSGRICEAGIANMSQEEFVTAPETTVEAVAESAGPGEDEFRPETDRATVTLEALKSGQVKSVEVTGEKVSKRKESVEEKGKAEVKQQKLKTTKTTVQTVAETISQDAEDYKPDTDRATVILEAPMTGHVKSVEVAGEKVVKRKESLGEIGKARMRQDELETTKTRTVETTSSGALFQAEDTKSMKKKAVVRQEDVTEQLPSTTTQTVGEALVAAQADTIGKEKALVRPESPESGLVQTTSTSEEIVSEAPRPKPRKEKAKRTLGTEKLEAAHAKTIETATGQQMFEQVQPDSDVASVTKIQSEIASSVTVQTLEGTMEYSKTKTPKSKAIMVQEETDESREESVQPITETAKPGVAKITVDKERAAVTQEIHDATLRTVQPVGEQATVNAKKIVTKDKATIQQEAPGQASVTKIQHTDEAVRYQPTPEVPERDQAMVVKAGVEQVTAETTQLIAEEVVATRKEQVAEKVKAKPKQDKLKPVNKTETRSASEAAKTLEADLSVSSVAKLSVEESERVLPTGEVETASEVTRIGEFESPEEVVAVEAEESNDVTDQKTVTKVAKIIEVG